MLGELPNSFLKRRAGIVPGAGADGRFAWFFYLYDQVDLLLFVFPVWWCLGALTWQRLALALSKQGKIPIEDLLKILDMPNAKAMADKINNEMAMAAMAKQKCKR